MRAHDVAAPSRAVATSLPRTRLRYPGLPRRPSPTWRGAEPEPAEPAPQIEEPMPAQRSAPHELEARRPRLVAPV